MQGGEKHTVSSIQVNRTDLLKHNTNTQNKNKKSFLKINPTEHLHPPEKTQRITVADSDILFTNYKFQNSRPRFLSEKARPRVLNQVGVVVSKLLVENCGTETNMAEF